MDTKYVISIRFNSDTEVSGRCQVDCTSKAWIKERVAVFNKYTRKSLEKQSNQDFIAVLSCQEASMPYIKEVLMAHPMLPNNIIFTCEKDRVIEDYITGADKVYIASLDSDDLYHPGFIQYLHEYQASEEEQLLIFRRGYIYNVITGIVSDYEYVAPAFYTQIFKVEEYLTTYRYYKLIRHFYTQRLNHTVIKEPMYLIILHQLNSFKYYKEEYPKLFGTEQILEDWEEVLGVFGLKA